MEGRSGCLGWLVFRQVFADPGDLDIVRAAVPEAPVWIGSGLTLESLPVLGSRCDGAIVGTTVKQEGRVDAPVDAGRVRALRGAWSRA